MKAAMKVRSAGLTRRPVMPTRRFLLLSVLGPLLFVLGIVLGAMAAWAYWTTAGGGNASASTGSINAPTAVVASNAPASPLVVVSWTNSVPAAGTSPSGYYVTRVRNSDSATFDACGSSAASPTATTPCNDTSVPDGTYSYVVTGALATWTATSASSNNLTIDTTAPTVTGVTSPLANGSYQAAQVVPVTVTFSENVTVTGTPQLTLSTGSPATTAVDYTSGSGTSVLTFTYTVVAGNTSLNLDYDATSSLALNGGTIRDLATNDATLTLATPGAAGSLGTSKSLVIDTTAPVVTGVSSPLANGSYKAAQVVPVTVTFSENVTVTGTPKLTLSTDSPATTAVNYTSGSGTSVLTFTYTVVAGNTSLNLDYDATTSLTLNSGTIRDLATNDATLILATPGTAGSLGDGKSLVIDTTAPTVTGVSSTLADGSYKAAQVVPVTVTFSENVTVTGTPRLTLSTFSPATTAVNYTSGSGTNVLTFNYTVAALNTSSNLDYALTTSLALNSGTIRDLATNNATLTLASPGTAGSLGDSTSLVIDTTLPKVTGVSSTLADGIYGAGQVVPVTITFSENVNVTGTPRLTLSTGSPSTTLVNYTSGSGTNVLTFTYTVAAANFSADLNYSGTTSLALNSGTIRDLATNNATLTLPALTAAGSLGTNKNLVIDARAPTVTGVTSPLANGSYKAAQVIPVTVTFSEIVTVTGTPRLTLSTGSPATTAVDYTSGSGTNVLTFTYTVAAGNTSADLNYSATTSLALNGGTIRDALANNATLTLAGLTSAGSLGTNKNLVIDTTAPVVSGVTSALANGSYNADQVIPVTVTFSQSVTVTGTPQLTLSTGSPATTAVDYTSGSGTTVLTFTYTVAAGNTSADLNYAATTSLALNGGTIQDLATNDATLTLAGLASAGSLGTNKNLVIDTTAPVVTGVTSSLANGSYSASQVIPVTVTFSKNVTVTGTPQLTLSTGSPATTAVDYTSGSGTSVLTFTYTVVAGNTSPDLDYAATISLALNGGFIRDLATNDATLTLASPGAAGSLGANKNLVILP